MILSFLENIHEKPLVFDRMHENKIFFYVFKMRDFFFGFFEISDKIQIFLISNLYLRV
jgi:hypothetical protein